MFRRNIDPIRRRNSLLMLAGIFMIIAVMNKPSILLFFTSPRGLISTALTAFAGLLTAIGINNLAQIFLHGRGEPWYARRGALFFLLIILLAISALLCFIEALILGPLEMGHLILSKGTIYQFMAMGILWIVILEWPH